MKKSTSLVFTIVTLVTMWMCASPVSAANVTGLTWSPDTATYGRNFSTVSNIPTVTGGPLTSCAIDSTLPAGLTFNPSTCGISGTPIAAAKSHTYKVTAQPGNYTDSLRITVNGFHYGSESNPSDTSAYVFGAGFPLSIPGPTGAVGNEGYYSSPSIPLGLLLDPVTGEITGTPVSPTASGRIEVTRSFAGASASETVRFVVQGLDYGIPPSIYWSQGLQYGIPGVLSWKNGTPVSIFPGSLVGGNDFEHPDLYRISPALPAGWSLDSLTGELAGIPTAVAKSTAYNIVRTAGTNGIQDRISLLISVLGFSYSQKNPVYTRGRAITPNSIPAASVKGSPSYFHVDPALPPGLILDSVTGTVSGTPTVRQAATAYVVRSEMQDTLRVSAAVGGLITQSGISSDTLVITVAGIDWPTHSLTFGKNVPIDSATPSTIGLTPTFCSVTPSLPAGLILNTSTCVLSGTPQVSSPGTRYTTTAIVAGVTVTDTLNITVNGFTYAEGRTDYSMNSPITANLPGSVIGNGGSYRVIPDLPAGLTLDASTGAIQGTPTAAAARAAYVIERDFFGGAARDTVRISVRAFSHTVTTAVYGKNIPITPNPVVTNGGAVTGCSAPQLTASTGLTVGDDCSITGTPTKAAATAAYPITALQGINPVTDTLIITVTGVEWSTPSLTVGKYRLLPLSQTIVGKPTNCTVAPALPGGLSLGPDCVLSGTSATASAATSYLFTASIGGQSTTSTLALAIVGHSHLYPSATYRVNTPITPNSVLGGTPTGCTGDSLTAATGLTVNGDCSVSGTPTRVAPTGRYGLTGIQGGVTVTDSVTVSVAGFSWSPSTVTLAKNSPVTLSPATGTLPTSCSVTPALPTGLVLDAITCRITGTPGTPSELTAYAFRATVNGISLGDTLRLAVSGLKMPPGKTLIWGAGYPVTNGILSGVGGNSTCTLASLDGIGLPPGVSFNGATCTFSGTPVSPAARASFLLSSSTGGVVSSDTLGLRVNGLAWNPDFATFVQNNPANSGLFGPTTVLGTLSGCSASPALPEGVTLDANCKIDKPVVSLPQPYTPYTFNTVMDGISTASTAKIRVLGFAYASQSLTFGLNHPVPRTAVALLGGASVTCPPAATDTLRARTGLDLDANCTITGTPTVPLAPTAIPLNAIAENVGATNIPTFTINGFRYTVRAGLYARNGAIPPNTVSKVVGSGGRYTVTPDLPPGLMLDPLTGVISGTPTTASPSARYAITRDFTTASATDTISIGVTEASLPVLQTVTPVSGTSLGGTRVTLTGSNFIANPEVTFGGGPATVVYSSPSADTLQVLTPAHASGTVGIRVKQGSFTSADSGSFRFFTLPDAPSAVSAVAGNAQAVVSWTAPARLGDSALTGYLVTSNPGSKTCTTTGATSCVVPGLANGTAYGFTVQAITGAGTGPASGVSAAVIPATLPGAPTAVTRIVGNGSLAIRWTAPSSDGGSSLLYYTARISGDTSRNCTATPPALTCTITGLTNGTNYGYSVTATNAVGTGPSGSGTAGIPATVPGSPTAINGVAGNGSVTLSWTAPVSNGGNAISGYTATAVEDGTRSCSVNASTFTCTVTGLTNGTAYTFTVTAANVAGTGAPSASSSPAVPMTLPGSPQAASASWGNAQAVVTFGAPADNGGSAVLDYTVTSSPGGVSATGASSPVTVTGLTNGIAYTFKVTARNAVGRGDSSSATAPVIPAGPAGAPTAVAGSVGNTQVTVTFAAPADSGGSTITSYTVTANPAGISVTGKGSPLVVSGLTNGTPYTFTVRATNITGPGQASAASAPVTPNAPPAIAYGDTATFTQGTAITALSPRLSGGPATSYAIEPSLSGVGLTFNTTTGVISGTPTVAQATTPYQVTATGPGGTGATSINLTIRIAAPVLVFTPSTLVDSTSVPVNHVPSVTGIVTLCSVTPALPAGLTLNSGTCALSGTPTAAAAAAKYTIRASNTTGFAEAVITLTVIRKNVSIRPDAFVIRVNGKENPYAFKLPPGFSPETQKVTMEIVDGGGRTVWSKSVTEADGRAGEVSWNGKVARGIPASAGMYVVRIRVTDGDGKTTNIVRSAVTLKPR